MDSLRAPGRNIVSPEHKILDSVPSTLGKHGLLSSRRWDNVCLVRGAGPIPKELGNLYKLETLLLEQNYLSGKGSNCLGLPMLYHRCRETLSRGRVSKLKEMFCVSLLRANVVMISSSKLCPVFDLASPTP